jgi:hypothetical protein
MGDPALSEWSGGEGGHAFARRGGRGQASRWTTSACSAASRSSGGPARVFSQEFMRDRPGTAADADIGRPCTTVHRPEVLASVYVCSAASPVPALTSPVS